MLDRPYIVHGAEVRSQAKGVLPEQSSMHVIPLHGGAPVRRARLAYARPGGPGGVGARSGQGRQGALRGLGSSRVTPTSLKASPHCLLGQQRGCHGHHDVRPGQDQLWNLRDHGNMQGLRTVPVLPATHDPRQRSARPW